MTERWAANSPSNGVNGVNGLNGVNGVNGVNRSAACGAGEKCCKNKKSPLEDDGYNKVLYDSSEFVPYDPSQEPIFPPELQLNVNLDQQFLTFSSDRVRWFRPTTLPQLLDLKQKYSDAKLVVGNTELGVEVKFKHCDYPVYINPAYVPQLTQVNCTKTILPLSINFSFQLTLKKICSSIILLLIISMNLCIENV